MSDDYSTLDEHIELLTVKGYFAENFKTAAQLGYWLREFGEQFDQCLKEAMMERGESRFMMPITGTFNNGLHSVRFIFRYKYDYNAGDLSLVSLHTQLGQATKTYYITDPEKLVRPEEVYECLNRPIAAENNIRLYIKLWHEFQHQRNPDNDNKLEDPEYRPPRDDLKYEASEYKLPKVGVPPKLRH
jgi:hypothetical protein